MATKQGMCRNCGSLVVFDDRDDTCECVFCHCVFPSEEAVALLANPDGHEFKNEKFEAKEGGKHYYSNPVMPDTVSKAVQRDAVSSKNSDDLKLKPSEFEVSPNDVKAPRKAIEADINTAFDSIAKEDVSGRQYIIYGLSCQNIKLSLPSGIDKATAQNYYSKYCDLRAAKRDGNNSGSVKMEIFTPDTIYFVSGEGVTENVQETVVITESTAAETSESKK